MKTRFTVIFPVFIIIAVLFSSVQGEAGQPSPSKKSARPPARILMILTGIDKVPDSDRTTGFWAEEFVVPCEIFKRAGYKVSAASIKGGRTPVDEASIDPKNIGDEPAKKIRLGLDKNKEFTKTLPLAKVDLANYAAIFVVGGHGVMWDLTNSPEMKNIVQQAVSKNRVVSAVCHGPGALLNIPLETGRLFLDGKKITGFSAQEEEMAGMTRIVPYCLEEQLDKESGKGYQKAGSPWVSFVVSDENLVTGQNPASSGETAQTLIRRLRALRTSGK